MFSERSPVVSSAHEEEFTPPVECDILQVIRGQDDNER